MTRRPVSHPYQAILAKWIEKLSEGAELAPFAMGESVDRTADGEESQEAALRSELDRLAEELREISVEDIPRVDFDVERFLRQVQDGNPSEVSKTTGSIEAPQAESPFSDLEFLECIGCGTYGEVYRGRWEGYPTEVAVKRLRCEFEPEQRKRFQREWKIQKSLAHRNILATLEWRESGNALFMIMEFIDGRTLKGLKEVIGELDVAVVQGILLQLVAALSYAHRNGIVHRDLKPSNIMLDRTGRVVVLDFGLASLRFSEDPKFNSERINLTSYGRMMGSVDYIAPEQIEDARLASVASDCYSLACVAYFLFCGQPPFPATRYPAEAARLMAHCSLMPPEVISLREDAPLLVSDWIQRSLAKSAEHRPTLRELGELIDESAAAEALALFVKKNV